ncbi:MAG: ABC transporter substrate-binding protein [bacterium]
MTKNNKSVFFAVILLLVVSLMIFPFGCKKKEEASKPQAKAPFNIGFNEWVGFAPFFLAKEKGFFGDLQVETQFIAVEGDKRAGLYSGNLQMICETMDMLQANRDTLDYSGKVIFGIDESYGGDGVLASDKVKKLKDVKGKTVIGEPGSASYFILLYLLNKDGLGMKDINFLSANSSDAAAAFIARKVEVAGTYEPYLSTALKKRKGAHILVSSKDLPGLIVDVAIVSEDVLSKRNEDVKKIYAGWTKALEYFEKNPDESIAIMAKAFKMTPEEFKDTISGIRYFGSKQNLEYFGSENSPGKIFEIFGEIGTILKANNLTKEVEPANKKIDLSIIAAPK